jgi:hypothetical protein
MVWRLVPPALKVTSSCVAAAAPLAARSTKSVPSAQRRVE